MNSFYIEYPTLLTNALSDDGSYPAQGPASTDNGQPSLLCDPFMGSLVSMISSGIPKVTHVSMSQGAHTTDNFGDLPSGGTTFPGIEVDNSAVAATSERYPQDFLTDWIDKPRVQCSAVDQWHGLTNHVADSIVTLLRSSLPPVVAPVISSPGPTLVVPATVLGKRPRGAEGSDNEGGPGTSDGHLPHLRKRGKERKEATGSSSRARHKPATRTQTSINKKSETAGRGAKKLATPNMQEVSYQPMPGPSIQQVLVWPTAPEKLTWVEGSVEGVWHHDSSVVRQEAVGNEEQAEELLLLAATQVDWERAAVDVLKCRPPRR
jgi:hypothetical protein